MPFDLSLSEGTKVIDLVFTGSVTIPERSDALRAVVKAHTEHGFIMLLADFSQAMTVVESEGEMFAYAGQLAKCWVLKPFSIAYVGDQNRTAGVESVAAEHGYFFQRFFTREAATSWLADVCGGHRLTTKADPTPQQAVDAHYREWLEATLRERSNFNGVLFARQVTNLGRDLFEGMTEEDICQAIGCDWRATELTSGMGVGKPGTLF